jgi:D-beta-D-heptose 7-phosphate kinase/D-beta-D-heptose 1-phosphate adenosyltransferase
LHLPARAREVFDVTGAGDTVISTLAAAIAAGEDCPAVALANLAAGIVVGKLGTAAISA